MTGERKQISALEVKNRLNHTRGKILFLQAALVATPDLNTQTREDENIYAADGLHDILQDIEAELVKIVDAEIVMGVIHE